MAAAKVTTPGVKQGEEILSRPRAERVRIGMRSGIDKGDKEGNGNRGGHLRLYISGWKWNGVERSKASEIKDKKRSDSVQSGKERPF